MYLKIFQLQVPCPSWGASLHDNIKPGFCSLCTLQEAGYSHSSVDLQVTLTSAW